MNSEVSAKSKGTVCVGLSGGVDSSVSALRLKNEGYNVIGVFIKTWHPDFLVCDWEKERLDAMRVAAHLQIPFYTCDAEHVYKKDVADYMIREYEDGRTPNPDVMCNQFVKFGVFIDFAKKLGATKIATGHYAQVAHENGAYRLYRGVDTEKDQSYFLWTLTQEQLGFALFPIGDTCKKDIRKEAEEAGLPTFAKNDSQGICFLGQVDIREFLSHYVSTEPGSVIDEKGDVIGIHEGALYYTLGQRHGFTLHTKDTTSQAQYVVAKNIQKNTITVAQSPRRIEKSKLLLINSNISRDMTPIQCEAQFRYRQKPFPVTFKYTDDTHGMLEVLETSIEYPSAGQSCVLYKDALCLGGGVIHTLYENN